MVFLLVLCNPLPQSTNFLNFETWIDSSWFWNLSQNLRFHCLETLQFDATACRIIYTSFEWPQRSPNPQAVIPPQIYSFQGVLVHPQYAKCTKLLCTSKPLHSPFLSSRSTVASFWIYVISPKGAGWPPS